MSHRVLVGIVGPRHDDEVLALSRALRDRGAKPRVIDTTGLPGAHRLELRDHRAAFDGRPLDDLDAVYVRRLRYLLDEAPLVEAATEVSSWDRAFEEHLRARRREREVSALLWSALSLIDAPVINPLDAQLVHPRKLHHLRRLAGAGLPVPPTLATNDPDEVRSFARDQGAAGVVIKPLRGLLKTRELAPNEPLPTTARPVLVQRLVRGTTIRAYAIDGRVVAAAAMHNSGAVDSSIDPRPAELVEPTDDERDLVSRAARATGLIFTGMDLQRPAGGGPTWVLECNAAPMFASFCRRTGADVAGPLADALLDRAAGEEGAR